MIRIQIITLAVNFAFLGYIAYLIVKGRLREEYAIVWCVSSIVLICFSLWQRGLELVAEVAGVSIPANLIFAACIFGMLVYLLHLSVVASRLHEQNKNSNKEGTHKWRDEAADEHPVHLIPDLMPPFFITTVTKNPYKNS